MREKLFNCSLCGCRVRDHAQHVKWAAKRVERMRPSIGRLVAEKHLASLVAEPRTRRAA